jgi:hypothetical protein
VFLVLSGPAPIAAPVCQIAAPERYSWSELWLAKAYGPDGNQVGFLRDVTVAKDGSVASYVLSVYADDSVWRRNTRIEVPPLMVKVVLCGDKHRYEVRLPLTRGEFNNPLL